MVIIYSLVLSHLKPIWLEGERNLVTKETHIRLEQAAGITSYKMVVNSEHKPSPCQTTEVGQILKVSSKTREKEQKTDFEYKVLNTASFKFGEDFKDAKIPTEVSKPTCFEKQGVSNEVYVPRKVDATLTAKKGEISTTPA